MLRESLVGRYAAIEEPIELSQERRVFRFDKVSFALVDEDYGALLRPISYPNDVDIAVSIDVTCD